MEKVLYFIKDGRLYCDDGVFDEPIEVTCTVEAFLECLENEVTE